MNQLREQLNRILTTGLAKWSLAPTSPGVTSFTSTSSALTTPLALNSLAPTPTQQEQLLDYIELLAQWNQRINLTAVRDPIAMVSYHLLDSLSVHPYLRGDRCADVGSGAGLPSIPLAIVNPQRQFISIDRQQKKINFQKTVQLKLSLNNFKPVCCALANYDGPAEFTDVCCRAVGALADLWPTIEPYLIPGGQAIFMKGALSNSELTALAERIEVAQSPNTAYTVYPVTVPHLSATRQLVVVRKGQ